jgi:hypothetical protein
MGKCQLCPLSLHPEAVVIDEKTHLLCGVAWVGEVDLGS